MQVKTYTGTGTQEVLARVKAELGPDAIILGSREFRQGGQRMFEITAGVERPEAETAPGAAAAPAGWEEWHREWSRVKDHLYALMQPAIQWERLSPRQRVALEYLQREGVEDDVVVELYRALLDGKSGTSMLSALAALVPVRGFGPELWPQRIHILAGPFGTGKTTAALRLGMNLRAANPGATAAYLNADCGRGNGRLVLRHWAELSDFVYYETPDASSMKSGLRACQNTGAIFVDMPGLGRDENLDDKLLELGLLGLTGEYQPAVHLALPPHYGGRQLDAFLKRYRTTLPCSLVWTKLDEAVNFGSLVNVAVRSGLPVSALSFGPELQASLVPAEAGLIWRLLLKRQLPDSAASGQTT
ncbi:MAG: flagellar biosynthesis protein FlhF [Desulfovibrionaceae bacterium]|nr:flagellar biosynthesis protein FlhF [Desulfovibrionaceae bacterium]